MENKLKQSIREIQDEEFANIVISPSTDKLYELVQDVAVKFIEWVRTSNGVYIRYGINGGYEIEGQLKDAEKFFSYFIENIYKQ